MKKIRQLFVRGLIALIPVAATIYIIHFLFSFMDNILRSLVERVTGQSLPGVGLVLIIVLIFLTGFIITNVIGQRIYKFAEKLLRKIPIVQKIYFGVKQIIEAFSVQGKQAFNKVALVEYPRAGTFVLGFVTGECRGEVQEKASARLTNVFIPTTPNPTSGMLVMVPDEQIKYLDMSVEEGLKLIVSAGVVVPEE